MSMLADLAKPFPPDLIEQVQARDDGDDFTVDYVAHSHVVEKLLYQHGPFSFTVDEILRDPETTVMLGCLATLTLTIDGRTVVIREMGEGYMKNAVSDALKRCAMRAGVGLHLWCGPSYRLDKALARREQPPEEGSDHHDDTDGGEEVQP